MDNHAATPVVRVWGAAVLAHLMANPAGLAFWRADPLVGAVEVLMVGLAVAVMVRARLATAATLGALMAVNLWLDAPVVGNHALLTGLGGLAAVLAVLSTRTGHGEAGEQGAHDRWLATLRPTLLIAYGFIAFSKVNTGFLDSAVSCGVTFMGDLGAPIGLGGESLSGHSGLATFGVLAVLTIELAIPVLLVVARSRRPVVVACALVFHFVIGLDPARHFWDFTATLLPFYLAFLPHQLLVNLEQRIDPTRVAQAAAAGAIGLAPLLISPSGSLVAISFWLRHLTWIVAGGAFLATVIRVVVAGAPRSGSVAGDPSNTGVATARLAGRGLGIAALVPALALLNGLAPYAEIKTANGWNMYANLVTSGGETNHLVLPRTFPVDGHGGDTVRIVSSSDAALDPYIVEGWMPTMIQLRDYVADHPDLDVSFERNGEVVTVVDAGSHSELGEPVPQWMVKLRPFRSLDAGPAPSSEPVDSPRCQEAWFALR